MRFTFFASQALPGRFSWEAGRPDNLKNACGYWVFWSGRRDLNPRPLVSQTSALTGLRYAPTPEGCRLLGVFSQARKVRKKSN
jgi:hypothetical protein